MPPGMPFSRTAITRKLSFQPQAFLSSTWTATRLRPILRRLTPRIRFIDGPPDNRSINPMSIKMTQSSSTAAHERIIDTMIRLTRLSNSHRAIVAGGNFEETFVALHRRGFLRVTTNPGPRVATPANRRCAPGGNRKERPYGQPTRKPLVTTSGRLAVLTYTPIVCTLESEDHAKNRQC